MNFSLKYLSPSLKTIRTGHHSLLKVSWLRAPPVMEPRFFKGHTVAQLPTSNCLTRQERRFDCDAISITSLLNDKPSHRQPPEATRKVTYEPLGLSRTPAAPGLPVISPSVSGAPSAYRDSYGPSYSGVVAPMVGGPERLPTTEFGFVDVAVNPFELCFLPTDFWTQSVVTLSSVVRNFFKARSTKKLRFEHKLWNALVLTKRFADLIQFIGVCWVSNTILKVNRDRFGALINVTRPAAALFNSQGSFLTHGFSEISKQAALDSGVSPQALEDVDEFIVRLYVHSSGAFTAVSCQLDVAACRWSKET